jgi:mannosyltransferase
VNVANTEPGSKGKPSDIQLTLAPALGILTLITILAAFFRFHALAARTFWFDEGVSVGVARLDWYNFGRILWRREANMSLYYLLLRIWLHLGQSEAFIRALSVILGLAAIPILYLLGRRLFSLRAGLIAALLLAVNANHVRYSQEARSYSLMVLLCAASSLFFLKCLELPSRRNRIAYVLFSAAAVYAHFYSVLLIIAQGLSLLFLERESIPREMKKDWRWITLLVSPIAVFVATTGAGPLRWIPRPEFKDLWELGLRLTGNDGALLFVAYAIAVMAAIVPMRSGSIRQRVNWENWRYRFLLLWLLFPILSVLALSFARPLFLQRYFILCLPALLLLAAAGLSRIRSGWLMTLAALVLAGLSVQGTESYYRHDFENAQRDNWRAASQYILANYQPDDALVFHIPMGRIPYEYYHSLQAQASAGPAVLYPSHGPQVVFLDFVEKPSYNQLAQLIPRYRRLWLVLSYAKGPSGPDETSTALAKVIAADHPNMESHDFTGVEVFLYSGDHGAY